MLKPLSTLFMLGAPQPQMMESLQSGEEAEEQPLSHIRQIATGEHGQVYEVWNPIDAGNYL